MRLITLTSPHGHAPLSTSQLMYWVVLATVPGIVALTLWFGFGTLVNILWASVIAAICEAAVLALRKRPVLYSLGDGSALVTAVLIGISLPPSSPWWLIAVGTAFAIIIVKHLYGGLGYNVFNPAMAAYVVLLISFPVQMTSWLAPQNFADTPGIFDAIARCFTPADIDALTAATPLDLLKQNNALTIDTLWQQHSQFGFLGGKGWEWANAGFLIGGLFLLHKRVFTWHAPVAMLAVLAALSLLFYDNGSAGSLGSPLFHLFSGASLFGAFFIVTDPVTSAVSTRGRLVYGGLIGLLVYVIRAWGNYPDAVAFAVLIANFCAPFIDYYTKPVVYGHGQKAAPNKRKAP